MDKLCPKCQTVKNLSLFGNAQPKLYPAKKGKK